MRTFAGGATRNDDSKKNDYRGFVSPIALRAYGDYMTEHRVQKDGTVRASDNWKNGIPRKAYLSSIKRHDQDVHLIMEGHVATNPDTGEPVTLVEALSALMFNVQGLLHEVLLGRDTGETPHERAMRESFGFGREAHDPTDRVIEAATNPEKANLVPKMPQLLVIRDGGREFRLFHSYDGGDFHQVTEGNVADCDKNHRAATALGAPNSVMEYR